MEAETALPVPRNPSMFSVNCVRSLGYCEPTAGGDDEKNGDARYALDLLSCVVVFVKKRTAIT